MTTDRQSSNHLTPFSVIYQFYTVVLFTNEVPLQSYHIHIHENPLESWLKLVLEKTRAPYFCKLKQNVLKLAPAHISVYQPIIALSEKLCTPPITNL